MAHEEMCKQYAQEKLEQVRRLSELNRKQRKLRELNADIKEIEAIQRDIEKHKNLQTKND